MVKAKLSELVRSRFARPVSRGPKVAGARSGRIVLAFVVGLALAACGGPTGVPDAGGPPAAVARLEFGPATGSVPVGATVSMLAQAFDAQGNVLTGVSFAFASSAPGVIQVDGDGVGTARAVGSATLSVRVGTLVERATLDVTQASGAQPGIAWASTTPQRYEGVRAFAVAGSRAYAVVGTSAPDSGPGVALLRSDDAGRTWRPSYAPDLFDLADCGWSSHNRGLSVDPAQPDRVFVACGNRLLRSTDGGGRFALVFSDGSSVPVPEFHATDRSFATLGSAWHSFDSGATWLASGAQGTRWVSPTDSRHWVDRRSASLTRVTFDAGATWRTVTPVPPPSPTGCTVNGEGTVGVAGDGAMLVAVGHTCPAATTSVYRSDDDGLSWGVLAVLAGADHTTGPGPALRGGELRFSPVNPNAVYVVRNFMNASSPMFRSVDGGATWSQAALPAAASGATLVLSRFEVGGLVLGASSSPNEHFVSHDHGATWTSTGFRGPSGTFVQTGDGSTFAYGFDGIGAHTSPLWTSTDFLRSSTPVSAVGLTSSAAFPSAVSAVNPDQLRSWAALFSYCGLGIYQSLGLVGIQSLDRGVSWSSTATPALYAAQSPARPARWYFATHKGGVRRSDDHGATYTLVGTLPYSAIGLVLAPSRQNADRVYALTDGGVYRSEDGGVTWTWASDGMLNVTQADLAVYPTNDRVLYVGGPRGVHKSTDAGATWRLASVGLRDQVVSSLALTPDGTTVFAGTCDGSIYRSLDAAGTWERVTTGFRSYRVNDVLVDPSDANVVMAATVGGVYRSTDKGSSWRLASVGLHSPFASWLATAPDGRTLYVGSADHGLYRGAPSASIGAPFSTASVAVWMERAGVR